MYAILSIACLAFSVIAVLRAPRACIAGTVTFSSNKTETPVSTDTRDGRLIIFDDIWQTISDRYYDPSFNGVGWAARREEFRSQAAAANGRSEFYSVIERMISTLKDTHTRVLSPEMNSDWRTPRYINVGLRLHYVDGVPVVASVEPVSDAARAGIKLGDQILRIDGVKPFNAGDSEHASNSYSMSLNPFRGEPGTIAVVDYEDRNAKRHTANLKRTLAMQNPSLSVDRYSRDTAVIRLDAFTEPILKQLQDLLSRKHRRFRAIVLDIRSNGGGDANVMSAIASMFLSPGTDLGSFFDRNGQINLQLSTASESSLTARDIPVFSGPLAILIANKTASAAEIFAAAIERSGRGKIVGQRSCGCVLAIENPHTLADGGALEVSELDFRTPDGLRLERRGVTPQLSSRENIDDIRLGRDPALEMALSQLSAR